MNKQTKKIISLVLALVLCLGVLPAVTPQAAAAGTNQYMEMTVTFPSNVTGVGTAAYYPIVFYIPNTVDFQFGDKLVYDVWMSRNAGCFGGIDLASDGSVNIRDNGGIDQNGIAAHPNANLDVYVTNQWYNRQIVLPTCFANTDFSAKGSGPAVMLASDPVYGAAALAGETVTIRYDNIKIVSSNGTVKHTIFTGAESYQAPGTQYLMPGLDGWDDVTYTYSVKTGADVTYPEVTVPTTPATQVTTAPAGGATTAGSDNDDYDPNDPHNVHMEMTVKFPANTSGLSGTGEFYPIAFWMPNTVDFVTGDKLVYDVWVSEGAAGFGAIDICSGAMNIRDTQKDQNNIPVHPTADLSGRANKTWYTRQVPISSSLIAGDFSTLTAGPAVMFPIHLPNGPSALAGKTITVRYDNIKIVDAAGNVKYTVYTGEEMYNVCGSQWLAPNLTGWSAVTYSYETKDLTATIVPTIPEEDANMTFATDPVDPTDPHNKHLQMVVEFPSNTSSLTGNGEFYPVAFWMPNTVDFELGDKLSYDVWMSENAGGFGAVDLRSGALNLTDEAVDMNAVFAHPTSDISTNCVLQWYTREILLPHTFADATFSNKGAGPAISLAICLDYNPSLLAGKKLVIRFDNIQIVDNEGNTKYTIFTGEEDVVPYGKSWIAPNLTGWNNVEYRYYKNDISPEGPVDPFPGDPTTPPATEPSTEDTTPSIDPGTNTVTQGNLTYKIINNKAQIIGCKTSARGKIAVPATVAGYPVVSVAKNAFSGCSGISLAFAGDAPTFASGCFNSAKVSAYYPAGNTTWTSSLMQQYGGTATWYKYTLSKSGDNEIGIVQSGSNLLCYKNGALDTSNTLYSYNGKWYHFKNGQWTKATGLVEYNSVWRYVKNGIVNTTDDALVEFEGKLYHVAGGRWVQGETKLYKYNDEWYYLNDGIVNTSNTLVKHVGKWYHVNGGKWVKDTTLVKYGSTWYYVKDGIKNTTEDTLVKYNGKWYHVADGKWVKDTTLVKYGNELYYVKGGVKDTTVDTLVRYDGKWYHVKNGMWVKDTTLVKYKTVWYYVKDGIKNSTDDTLVEYNGKWYHVANGEWAKDTALVKYGSEWYYVKGGIKTNTEDTLVKCDGVWYHVNEGKWVKDTTLVKYGSTWYYIKDGVMNTSETTLVKYGSKLYYVTGGKWVKTNTTVKYNGKTYKVVNGYGVA